MILNNNMIKSIKKMVLTVKKVTTINFHWLIDQYQSIKNRPFAACHSRSTKPPHWRAKVVLGQDKQKTCIIWNGNFLCLSCLTATFALQHGGFLPCEWQAAKVLLSVVTAWLSYMKNSREPLRPRTFHGSNLIPKLGWPKLYKFDSWFKCPPL